MWVRRGLPVGKLLLGALHLKGKHPLPPTWYACRNSRATIRLQPSLRNKALHDTFLRQGELKAEQVSAFSTSVPGWIDWLPSRKMAPPMST